MNLQKKNILIIIISTLIIASVIFLFLGLSLRDNKSKDNQNKNFTIEDIYLKRGESIDIDSLYNFKLEITNIKIDNQNIAYIENNKIYTKNCGETKFTIIGSYKEKIYYSNCKIFVLSSISSLNLSFDNSTTLYLLDKNKYEAYNNHIYDYTSFHTDYDVDIEILDENILNFDNTTNKFYAKSYGKTNVIFTSIDEPTYYEIVKFTINLPPLSINCQDEIYLNIGENYNLTLNYSINYYYQQPILNFESTKIYANLEDNNLNIIANEIGESYIYIIYNEEIVKQIKIYVNQIITPKLIVSCNETNYYSNIIEINTNSFTLSFTLEDYIFTNLNISTDKNLKLTKIMDNYYLANVTTNGEYSVTLVFDNEFTYHIIFKINE